MEARLLTAVPNLFIQPVSTSMPLVSLNLTGMAILKYPRIGQLLTHLASLKGGAIGILPRQEQVYMYPTDFPVSRTDQGLLGVRSLPLQWVWETRMDARKTLEVHGCVLKKT